MFRRSHANKCAEKYEDAVRDLQVLMKDCPNPEIKKDLDFCMAKFMEQRKVAVEEEKKRAEEAKNAPKIAEVKQEPKEFKKV